MINAVDYKRFESLIKQNKANAKTWSLKKDWLQFAINYHDSKHVTLRHARRLYDVFKKNYLKDVCNKRKAEIKCTNINAPTVKQKNYGDSFSESKSANNSINVIQPELSLNISSKVDSTGTSNPSPVNENCEIQPEEIYENILQDSIKTNNKEKKMKAMHEKFKSSTPSKPAQTCTKKDKIVQGLVQAACYGIVSSALDNILHKGFDEQAEILGLCNKVKQSLSKSRNFNDCDSFKETDLLTDTVDDGAVSNTPYTKEENNNEVTPSNDKSIFEEVGINHYRRESFKY